MSDRRGLFSGTLSERAARQFDVAFNITLAQRRFRARFAERVKETGQTDSRWSALYMLSEAPSGLIQAELAERMGVQGPTLVRLLDALEAQGLVARRPAPGDRRANRLFIEDAGLEMLRKIDMVASALRDEAFDGIPDADIEVAARVLETLAKKLGRAG